MRERGIVPGGRGARRHQWGVVLRALLIGPLRFTPIDDGGRRGYAFSGTVALDRLLAGAVEWPTMMASPTGTADGWPLKVAGVSGLDHAA